MAKKQKKYANEFKEYVSKMIVLDGKKQIDVSRELQIPYDTLMKWVRAYRKKQYDEEKARQNQLLTASEYKELYELERQKRLEAEEECVILKKAMHIFTQEK
ncbi:transposase [Ferdinandcohnia quinoae]|uniref:Transposase n=1 Tax=Fredinandcohnia quinoae TaxID=2918902 RepID=A0AAW5ED92_9BACI|nr:transposase [Fredinandcohnia sp. SECRCQ15]MCH1627685.1 transposase [Fredinandcohnia sp. SECRCQ15]